MGIGKIKITFQKYKVTYYKQHYIITKRVVIYHKININCLDEMRINLAV